MFIYNENIKFLNHLESENIYRKCIKTFVDTGHKYYVESTGEKTI